MVLSGFSSKLATASRLRPSCCLPWTSTPPRLASTCAATMSAKSVLRTCSSPAPVGSETRLVPRMARTRRPSLESSCGTPAPSRIGGDPSIDRTYTPAALFPFRRHEQQYLLAIPRDVDGGGVFQPRQVADRPAGLSADARGCAIRPARPRRRHPERCRAVRAFRVTTAGGERVPPGSRRRGLPRRLRATPRTRSLLRRATTRDSTSHSSRTTAPASRPIAEPRRPPSLRDRRRKNAMPSSRGETRIQTSRFNDS